MQGIAVCCPSWCIFPKNRLCFGWFFAHSAIGRFIWFNLEPKGCKEVESYTREKILRNNGFRTRFGLKSNLFDAAFLLNFAHGRAWLRLGGSWLESTPSHFFCPKRNMGLVKCDPANSATRADVTFNVLDFVKKIKGLFYTSAERSRDNWTTPLGWIFLYGKILITGEYESRTATEHAACSHYLQNYEIYGKIHVFSARGS